MYRLTKCKQVVMRWTAEQGAERKTENAGRKEGKVKGQDNKILFFLCRIKAKRLKY